MILKSLQWRLVSFFCLIAFCLIIPVWVFLNKSVENKYYNTFITKIADGFDKWNLKTDNPGKDDLISEMRVSARLFSATQNYTYYTIAYKNGSFIFSNDKEFQDNPEAATNELLQSANFVQAMTGTENNRKILESYGDREFFDYARHFGNYILYFRYYKEDWVTIINDFNVIIVYSLIIALAISFIVGYMLSKTITVPIVKLMNKARNMATGDFDQLPEVRSNDEISKLTESFNYMATSLKDTLTEISSEKNKMETIFNYMTDGIIAFNLDGDVIHTNPASRKMLGEEGPGWLTFTDYAKKYGIEYSIEDVVYLHSQNTRELSINYEDRTVKVYFAVFTDEAKRPEGIIAVLHDITEQQRLENMRKEFVANVSHELRTPLTSIKSYSESLLDGALDDREVSERFLGVINSEADRMTRLVKDLLQLSRLDNQQMQWRMEDISFEDLVKSVVERMQIEARNKKQTLKCHAMGDVPNIEADYGRIEQVIFNIIGNAIKYTPDGGNITVFIGILYSEVYVKVSDTGIGIPESDLPRIFERFYRVDKARSREMGGTGLGLSIAREIAEAHSGTISITSEANKGTEVTVRLPVSQPRHERLNT